MTCVTCGVTLPEGEWASCRAEQRCLEHCSDFAAHCSPGIDEEPELDEDRVYDAAADDAVMEAAQAGDIENWRAYMRGGDR